MSDLKRPIDHPKEFLEKLNKKLDSTLSNPIDLSKALIAGEDRSDSPILNRVRENKERDERFRVQLYALVTAALSQDFGAVQKLSNYLNNTYPKKSLEELVHDVILDRVQE